MMGCFCDWLTGYMVDLQWYMTFTMGHKMYMVFIRSTGLLFSVCRGTVSCVLLWVYCLCNRLAGVHGLHSIFAGMHGHYYPFICIHGLYGGFVGVNDRYYGLAGVFVITVIRFCDGY